MLLALLGGILIGLAVALLLFANGRVAGVSGVVGGLVHPSKGDVGWRWAFVGGLVAGGLVARMVAPASLAVWPVQSLPVLAVAGLLVGFGTRLAGGCTSGHGVCGVSRLSVPSLVATITFMGVAAAVVVVTRHARLG